MKLLDLWRHSFPFRLSLVISLIFALLVIALSCGAFLIVSHGLMRTLDDGLLQVVQSIAPQVSDFVEEAEHDEDRVRHPHPGLSRETDPHELAEARRELALFTRQITDAVQLQIVDVRGNLLFRSDNFDGDAIPLLPDIEGTELATTKLVTAGGSGPVERREPAGKWTTWLPPGGSVRAVYLPIPRGHGAPYYLVGAVSTEPVRSVLLQLTQGLAVSLILALLLVGLISLYFAWQAFQPIQTVTRTAEAIDETSLETRIRTEVQDATLQRLVEVLNRMLERLQSAFQARRRFIDNASHELRTPLTALRAELELALDRPRTSQEYQSAIAHALEEVDRLIELSEALLLLSKAGRSLHGEAGTQLRPLVARVVKRMETNARLAGVTVVDEIPEGLEVHGNARSLESMLSNLVQNAIEACTRECSVWIRASEQARGGIQGVAIQVEDNGTGMSPEVREKIFERFYQAKRDPKGGHAGLGLAIVREIVAAHRGQIEVTTEPDLGSRFTIWLPTSVLHLSGKKC